MSLASSRFAPRSAVSAADLEPLKAALVELEMPQPDPAATFLDLARRLVRFVAEPAEPEVRTDIVDLGTIAVDDRTRPTQAA